MFSFASLTIVAAALPAVHVDSTAVPSALLVVLRLPLLLAKELLLVVLPPPLTGLLLVNVVLPLQQL